MYTRVTSYLLVLSFAWMAPAYGQTVRYVDDDASTNGDGTTWSTAHRYLQDALWEASTNGAITEIRVAQGTYKPDGDEGGHVAPGDRAASFGLVDGVEVKGGYAGIGAPDPDARDVEAYETILSGDLAGNDGPGAFENNGENSYHVVVGSVDWAETIMLDGFTITGGNAIGPDFQFGAGMQVVFPGSEGGSVVLADCTFRGNWAAENGGGLCGSSVQFTLSRCAFLDNYGGGYGGGFLCGMWGADWTSLEANDCVFRGNSAALDGGAVFMSWVRPEFTNCTFSDNDASGDGGAVKTMEADPRFRNCVFAGNTAGGRGGAVSDYWFSYSRFTGCTLYGNLAGIEGGAIHHDGAWSEVTNCILWGDSPDEIASDPEYATATFSDIEGGWPGTGNINADPLFVDADGPDEIPGTEDDNLRLRSASPCINAGDLVFVPDPGETDLDGHARVLCGRVDMGAYEFGIGDYECDRDVDLADFGSWDDCLTGPDNGPYDPGCEAFDFEFDGDVDLQDFAGFQGAFAGV